MIDRELAKRLWEQLHKSWSANVDGYDKRAWGDLERVIIDAQTALSQPDAALGGPVAMLMFCPTCNSQHVDAPKGEWTNPPHATHTCQNCGLLWRPSNTNTAGVPAIECLEEKHRARIAASFPAPASAEVALSANASAQIMARVHNDRGQGEAWLNSVGRKLPDQTPLYAAPQSAHPAVAQEWVMVPKWFIDRLHPWLRQVSEQSQSRVASGIANAASRLYDELSLELSAAPPADKGK